MRRSLIVVAILLLAGATRAQSLAQPAVSHDCGGTSSCSVSLANGVTLGNTLLAVLRLGTTNVSATTVSDSLGNTYALDIAVAQTIDGHSLAIYRAQVTTSGTPTLSVANKSASTVRIIGFEEVTGLTGGTPDGITQAIGSSSTPQPGTVSPTQANDYVLLAASTANNESFSVGTGFHAEQSLGKGAFGDQYLATKSPVNGSISISSADQWAAIAVAYKAMPRLPISIQLNYSDGTPVQGSVQLSVVSGTATTPIATWPISSTGAVAGYLPLVSTGTYSYAALDPTGKQLQTITVLPGAFASLTGLHSIQGTVTLSKSTDALTIPASLALQ